MTGPIAVPISVSICAAGTPGFAGRGRDTDRIDFPIDGREST